jgi:signal transduction histidine kinase
MSSADEKDSRKEAPKPKPSRMEEAQRVIEEYLNDLREIISKLRRHLSRMMWARWRLPRMSEHGSQ